MIVVVAGGIGQFGQAESLIHPVWINIRTVGAGRGVVSGDHDDLFVTHEVPVY